MNQPTFRTCPDCKGHGAVPMLRNGRRVYHQRQVVRVPCSRCESSGEVTVVNDRELTPAESTELALRMLGGR